MAITLEEIKKSYQEKVAGATTGNLQEIKNLYKQKKEEANAASSRSESMRTSIGRRPLGADQPVETVSAKPVAEKPMNQGIKSPTQMLNEKHGISFGAFGPKVELTSGQMVKVSGLQVQEAELKLNQSKAKLDAARQKEMVLTEQSKKLASAHQGLRQLMTQYEMSGDEVTGQAYLLAAEEYNKLLEQYQKDYAAYEKDASVYDEYNSNLLKYQKAYAGYEKNVQAYNTERSEYLQEHPEVALQDASDREIQRALDRLEGEKSGLILTGKAVDWEAVEDVNRKIDAVKQLQQQKRLSADNGAWNSGLTAFLDRAEAAIQAGQMEWFAGVAAVDQKLSNAFLKIAGSQIASMGMSMRNADMEAYGKTLMENSNRESKDAADAMKASRDYMAEALTGAGKIDGWIVEKMQSVGSMMMDMMAAGSTYAMGIPAGADAGKIMAIRAGGSGMLQAQQEGKSETEQLLIGIATGALEYASERMFGGNPIYDAESGWVTDAVAKVIKNPKILKLMYSDGFGIFSEGLEEAFVSFMEPVAEGIITLEKPELATAAELADAFAGGVFLSLVGQGSSVVVREVSGAGRAERQAGRVIQKSDAVQDLVNEGLAAKPNTEAFKLATELQAKLDAGKKLSAAEIGRQLFANQDAIDAGLLVDDEMQPDSEAPEGALQDPDNGYYAILTAEADGKQTYQLAEVREDGSIRKIGQPADDLMAAKRAAQAQGMNVRHIGKEDVLRDAAQTTTDQINAANIKSTVVENAADNENAGLRWAGNEEGAYDYGTEQRNLGTGADQERVGGNADGRSAESQNGGWAGDTVRRAEEARRIRAYAENAGLERRSLKELGFAQGSDGKNLRVLNRSAGQDVAEAYDMAQSAGLRLVPVSGNMYVQMGADEIRVNGIIENGVIYAQADSTAMSIKEVVSHEIFHDRVKKDPGLVRRLVRYMFDNYSQQEISRQFQKYYDDYQEIYSGTASDADLNELIWEEFLADAYAEYSRYGDVALEGLSEEVQEQAWAGNENENATQELSRGVTENGSLAETTSAASETIIDRDGEGVNTRFSVSSEDRARQKAERDLARSIGEIMSMPRKAVQQLQTGLVREIMEEYQLTGELNTEKLEEAAANAFAQGLIIDNEYYEQYKHIRDQLRTTAVTISQQDQADIADYNQFRKRAFGTLRIVKQGGIPVDSLYQELMETTPELFPRTITHPADQLVHMYEVAREIRRVETPLERAMGEQSDQFYEWAEGKIAQTVERILTRYADSVTWKQQKAPTRKTAVLADDTPDTYDRANERMYDYGQQSYNELPEPGSGVVQEDYIQPEEGGIVWAGQSRMGNWRQEMPEYEADTYDRANERMFRAGQERIGGYDPSYPEYQPDTYDPRTQERMERFGQEIIDDYEPMPEEPEVLTEEEQARRGTMREWIQYVLSDKLTPEEFAERMRSSAVGELKGGAAKLVGRMEETARQRQGDGVNLYRDPDMTDEQYEALNAAWKNRQERKTEKLETAEQIIIPKEAFRSTPAMDKLGIKIDGSVTRYRETAQLRAYDEAAEKAQKMLNRRIRKLKASAEEMDLAKMLVKGTITPAMLDREALNLNVITELADYLGAVESFNDDRINQRRAEINTNNLKVAKELLQDSEAYHPQLPGVLAGMTKLVMNERTPERVVKQIFGAEQGGKLYETYFRPVWVNGAEMHRFENRMLKRVAEFKDQDGRTRKLTEKEREFAQRLMEGEAVRKRMEELEQKDPDARARIADAANNVNNGMEFLDAVRDQNIQDEEHQGLVQAYADYMDTVEAARDMDQTILWNAIRAYQQIYNEMYEAMNDFLVSHGYKPMGFIKGYAPHFQKREVQQGLFGAMKALGVEKESVTELPASIAGRTADFKPNMKWNPHMQSRQGTDTSYDIQMGFEQYLHYAAEMFYHTDDVMRIRQAVNWMRGQYSGEEISDAIKDAEVDQFKSVEWKHDFLLRKEFIKPQDDLDARAIQQAYQEYVTGLFERVKPENLRKYSEFVTWLDNYANIVAGKQSLADRGLEYGGGRNALNMGSKLMRRFASANVAGNISSVLNQSAQLPLLQQQLGSYLERAVFDLARGGARKESFAERSDFLTDKRGVDKLTTDNMEKFISGLFKPAEMMDRLVSTLAVRGRYLQALDQGMTPDEALKAADDFGRRVMGSRMKGARPLGFESKTFVNQMLHIFQTEASNTFDYMLLSDIPQAVKEVRKTKGKAAAARYTAGAIVGYLIGAFLLNSLTDELYGGSPAPFDLMGWLLNFVAGGWGRDNEEFVKTVIDNAWERAYGERPFETEQLDREEGFRWAGAADDLTYNVLGDVPYVRNALGVMGLGDQSMPTVGINDFTESVKSAGKTLWDQVIKGEEETGLDWAGAAAKIGEDLLDAATLVLPGGRQIQKSYQGIKGVAMGGKVSGFGENARLQYPIEQNAWNAIRAGLFGLTALDETDAFYAGGQALTAGQTQKVRELEDKGIDQNITYELYQEFRQINKDLEGSEASEAKRNAINNLPLEDQQKLTVFDTFMLDKSSKNYEKTLNEYQAMLDAGLSWSEVTDAHNTYAMLDADEEMRGTEKATEFAKWVDMQGWNDEQRGAVEARFRFWNMMPAEATNYTKFEAAGLDPEQAAAATELLAALTPEEGKETVSVNQKVMELQKSKLPAEEKMDAIAALVPDRQARFVEAGVSDGTAKTLAAEIAIAEAENGDDEVTYLEKARIAVDRTPNDEDALAAMSVVLNDSTYAKVEVIREYGVRCENWVSFREEWLDRYGDDSMSQEKVEAVLDRMNLDNRQKAALWQISNKSWKPDNNPYDAYVAEMVWDALN